MPGSCREFIEYIGTSSKLPKLNEVAAFKQFEIQEALKIPDTKPDMEQIIKVSVDVQVNCTKIITTPVATSSEGQVLTGKKIIVHGILSQEVVYVADTPLQSVHAAHYEQCFTAFIVVPANFPRDYAYVVRPYIEDIYAQMTGPRTLTKSVLILLTLSY